MFKEMAAAGFILTVLAAPLAVSAQGNPTNIPDHPRVNEVNRRMERQHERIIQGEKSGKINGREQRQLNHQYRQMKGEEHRMRRADNGHLTKQDQRILNRQENRRSHEIRRETHH